MKYLVKHNPVAGAFGVYEKRFFFFRGKFLRNFWYPFIPTKDQMLEAKNKAVNYVKLLKEIDDCVN